MKKNIYAIMFLSVMGTGFINCSSEKTETKEIKEKNVDVKDVAREWFFENVSRPMISGTAASELLGFVFFRINQIDTLIALAHLSALQKSEKDKEKAAEYDVLYDAFKETYDKYMRPASKDFMMGVLMSEEMMYAASCFGGAFKRFSHMEDREGGMEQYPVEILNQYRSFSLQIYSLLYGYTDPVKRKVTIEFMTYKPGSVLPDPEVIQKQKTVATGL